MLIRVTKTTWLCFDAIQKIELTRVAGDEPNKWRYGVLIASRYNNFSRVFDTFEEAEKFAQGIVDKLNAEAQHEKS
ncbi:MAG: hypothetical protein IJ774_08815 [Selenomonadaceae bacterium]|nr:hypothetical protein [Selenomonadaceae bacterium]